MWPCESSQLLQTPCVALWSFHDCRKKTYAVFNEYTSESLSYYINNQSNHCRNWYLLIGNLVCMKTFIRQVCIRGPMWKKHVLKIWLNNYITSLLWDMISHQCHFDTLVLRRLCMWIYVVRWSSVNMFIHRRKVLIKPWLMMETMTWIMKANLSEIPRVHWLIGTWWRMYAYEIVVIIGSGNCWSSI